MTIWAWPYWYIAGAVVTWLIVFFLVEPPWHCPLNEEPDEPLRKTIRSLMIASACSLFWPLVAFAAFSAYMGDTPEARAYQRKVHEDLVRRGIINDKGDLL